MKKITPQFNSLSVVKRGEVFDLVLPVDNSGAAWDLKVTSGKAKILSSAFGKTDKGDDAQHFIIQADQPGELEIQAVSKSSWWRGRKTKKSHTLKFRVE